MASALPPRQRARFPMRNERPRNSVARIPVRWRMILLLLGEKGWRRGSQPGGLRHLPALRVRQLPRLAIPHTDKPVGLVVAENSLVLRIPRDFVTGAIRDVTQMRHGRDMVTKFEVER